MYKVLACPDTCVWYSLSVMSSVSTCPQTSPRIYTGGYVALSVINVQNNKACIASSIQLAYDWLFSALMHSAHKRSSAINKTTAKPQVTGNFLTSPGRDWNPGSGEEQRAVSGGALDHAAVRAGLTYIYIL